MTTPYKQSYILVMENGEIVKWTGKADNSGHAQGLAVAYATKKTGLQVWDIANRPIITKN